MAQASQTALVNADTAPSWNGYWEDLREERLIFQAEAREYVCNLERAVPLDRASRLLDFGCGFGFVADLLATKVGEVFLWDASANMRERARRNAAARTNVRFLDLSDPGRLPPDLCFDLILVNSVVQYMSVEELDGWLARWRQMLAADGQLVLSDLIPPDHATRTDLTGLLKLSARSGLIARFVLGRLLEFRRYWRMRQAAPLARLSRDDLERRAAAAGLAVEFLPKNLTHLDGRMAAVLSKCSSSSVSSSN